MANRTHLVGGLPSPVGTVDRVVVSAAIIVVLLTIGTLGLVRYDGRGHQATVIDGIDVVPPSVLQSGAFEIDSASHQVVSEVAYSLDSPAARGAADGFGARWIPSQAGIAEVNPATGATVGEARLPSDGYYVVTAGKSVWATDQSQLSLLYQINPADLHVERRIFVTGDPYGNLYSGLGDVWETGPVALTQVDAQTGQIVARIPVTPSQPTDNAYVLAFGAGSVWAIDEHAPEHGRSQLGVLYRIDPTTHAIMARIPIPSPSPTDFFELAYGADTLWVADGEQGIVRAISPQSDAVTETFRVGYVDSIAAGGGSVWIVNATTTLTQLGLDGHTRWHGSLPAHPESLTVDGPRLVVTYGQTHPRGGFRSHR